MGRKKAQPKTEKQKRLTKVVTEIHKRDIDPNDKRSDTAILKQIGYSPSTKVCEVLGSKSYLMAHEAYYKNRKTPEELQNQLAAKARRNLYEGMDNFDPKIKLEYTKLQLNQEEKEAARTKLEIKDGQGNLMTLLGVAATDAAVIQGGIRPLTEIEVVEEDDNQAK